MMMMMKSFKYGPFFIKIMISAILSILTPSDGAGQSCEPWIVKVVSVQGIVQVRKHTTDQWKLVKLYDTYCSGDIIRVNENSRAALALSNDAYLRLDQNSTITITIEKKEYPYLITIVKGIIHFFSSFPKKIRVHTHFVNATIEGTEFYMNAEPTQTFLSLFEGKVAASNEAGALLPSGGETAVFAHQKAPQLIYIIKPRDSVYWALYYPPIINWKEGDFKGTKDWQGMVRKSIRYYWKGEITRAFAAISDAPEPINDPRFNR
jgi:hypothetical protein